MTERDLDGGSAAPATPDVPTCGSRLVLAPDDPRPTVQVCIEPAGHSGPHANADSSWLAVPPSGWGQFISTAISQDPVEAERLRRALRQAQQGHRSPLDHSGVAGEPEATPSKRSETAGEPRPTPSPSPEGVEPAAASTAGGVLVSAEAVARAFHETYERLAPGFGYETRKASAVPWEQVPENNRALMTAVAAEVAPLIAAQALRTAADEIDRLGRAFRSLPLEDAADWLKVRADELERGGDR